MNKLVEVQNKIKVPKAQFNKHGGYRYRSLEDTLAAFRKVQPENTMLRLFPEPFMLAGRFYIKVKAIFSDLSSGEAWEATGYAQEVDARKGMDPSQISGACQSYAGKYALNALFLLAEPDADDMDNTDSGNGRNKGDKNAPPKKEAPKPQVSQKVAIYNKLTKGNHLTKDETVAFISWAKSEGFDLDAVEKNIDGLLGEYQEKQAEAKKELEASLMDRGFKPTEGKKFLAFARSKNPDFAKIGEALDSFIAEFEEAANAESN